MYWSQVRPCDRVTGAPALEKWKVGIAEESATDVARGVSAFVLTSPKGPVTV